MPYMKLKMSATDYAKLKPFLRKKFITNNFDEQQNTLRAHPVFKHNLLDAMVDAGVADENYIYRDHKVNSRPQNGVRPFSPLDRERYGIGLREGT
ncbi:MAG: hypothetical protein COA43_00500 [Robiginitomaculum sp.]|nr:MAG: hypothetical protein COA43_00500 [Robiginitomaculum sp.]